MVSASFLLPGVLKTTQVNCLAMRQCCFKCHNLFLGLWNWTSRNLDDNRINWLWLLAIYWNQKKTQIQFKMPMSENDRFVSIPCAPALLLCLPCDRSLLFALFFTIYNNSLNSKYPCSSVWASTAIKYKSPCLLRPSVKTAQVNCLTISQCRFKSHKSFFLSCTKSTSWKNYLVVGILFYSLATDIFCTYLQKCF